MNHPWLKSTDWDAILNRKIKSPIQVNLLKTDSFVNRVPESVPDHIDYNIQGFTWTGEEPKVNF